MPAEPLHPEAARRAIEAHRAFFHGFGHFARELAEVPADLGRVCAAWRIESALGVPGLVVDYVLDMDVPFSAPRLYVRAPTHARAWLHVEKTGAVCLWGPTEPRVPWPDARAAMEVLALLARVVRRNLSAPETDAGTVRHRWVTDPRRAWTLVDPTQPLPPMGCASRVRDHWVVAGDRAALRAWLAESGERRERPRVPVAFVPIASAAELVWTTEDIVGIARQRGIPGAGLVVYVLEADPVPLLLAASIGSDGRVRRMAVDRSDAAWILQRTGGRAGGGHVTIVGCGSLGAGVATQLALAGVSHLTLVDDDVLAWDNVGRHVLGGDRVGQRKATALAESLRAHLPGMLTIEARAARWQEVAVDEPDLLRRGLVVNTTAGWPDDASISAWARRNHTPLVLGWIEAHAVAGHGVALVDDACFGCHVTPRGVPERELSTWPGGSPRRMYHGCHEHFLPYGYAQVAPTQTLVAQLALDVLDGRVSTSEHRLVGESPSTLARFGAELTPWARRTLGPAPADGGARTVRLRWPRRPGCWSCGGDDAVDRARA